MKVVKRSVEVLTKTPYEEMLALVEEAGRNCYQSYQNVSEGSAEKLIKQFISVNHGSPLEFADIAVRIVGDRSFMGQITRHRLSSFCLSGDTLIQSYSTNPKASGKKRTLKDLYSWYENPQCHAAFSSLVLRSVNDSSIVVPNKPVKVFYNGKKPVYRMTTESGRSIKATDNHQFSTKNGWVQLKDLSVGDYVYVNGRELLDNEEALGVFSDKIVSIEYAGVEDVYDIEMNEPYHNYVANGFVVHNCIESARYNNYASDKFDGEVSVIVPYGIEEDSSEYNLWLISCTKSCTYYKELINKGVKPETARSVLPMSLATHIVMKANIREWRHILKLRLDKRAQGDMIRIMKMLLEVFCYKYPVFFEDIYTDFGNW